MNRLRTHTPFYLTRPARVVYLIAAAVVAALLTGCGKSELSISERVKRLESPGGILSVSVDEKTGCQYLIFTGSQGGITPRMGRDGKQVCVDAALVGAK